MYPAALQMYRQATEDAVIPTYEPHINNGVLVVPNGGFLSVVLIGIRTGVSASSVCVVLIPHQTITRVTSPSRRSSAALVRKKTSQNILCALGALGRVREDQRRFIANADHYLQVLGAGLP